MNSKLRNALAVGAGVVLGSVVNGGLITLGGALIPPPAGVDMSSMESVAAAVHLFGLEHLVFPFLAHALGTLTGELICYRLAASRKPRLAWGMTAYFLLGGAVAAYIIPAPSWFIAADLILAYLPMGWLAIVIGRSLEADGHGDLT